jgi:hypothetical protein
MQKADGKFSVMKLKQLPFTLYIHVSKRKVINGLHPSYAKFYFVLFYLFIYYLFLFYTVST